MLDIQKLANDIESKSNEEKLKLQDMFSYWADKGRTVKGVIFTPEQRSELRLLIRWLEFNMAFGNDWYPAAQMMAV